MKYKNLLSWQQKKHVPSPVFIGTNEAKPSNYSSSNEYDSLSVSLENTLALQHGSVPQPALHTVATKFHKRLLVRSSDSRASIYNNNPTESSQRMSQLCRKASTFGLGGMHLNSHNRIKHV